MEDPVFQSMKAEIALQKQKLRDARDELEEKENDIENLQKNGIQLSSTSKT